MTRAKVFDCQHNTREQITSLSMPKLDECILLRQITATMAAQSPMIVLGIMQIGTNQIQ